MGVGDYPIAPFTSPVGTDRTAYETRGNDNVLRDKFVAHQADTVAHPTSGPVASIPGSADPGAIYFATDTGDIYIWVGGAPEYLMLEGATPPVDALLLEDGNHIALQTGGSWTVMGGQTAGAGTVGTLAKWTGPQELGNSIVSEVASALTVAGTLTTTGRVTVPASTTSAAGLTVPHGVAPTGPVNGDLWTTTSGLQVRINGATQYASWTEQAAVPDATGGTVIDSEARAALNDLLAKLRTLNIIAP